MKDSSIRYHQENGIALITLNRPSVYNALNKEAKAELVEAIERAGFNPSIRAIILTGEGKAFCTGQDLGSRKPSENFDLGETLRTEWNPVVSSMKSCKKVIIGAINGVCAGAGMSVALSCDLIVARAEVKFLSGFCQIGLIPDSGAGFLLPRHLGYQRAMEFCLLNKPLFAADLQKVGLINHVCDDVMQQARQWAEHLQNLPPLAVQELKRNLQKGQEESYAATLERETESQRRLGWTQDFKEGVDAFLQKRTPHFNGN